MTLMNRFKIVPGAAIAALALLPILTNGCSAANAVQNAQAGLCCTDFKPGTDMANASFTGDVQLNAQFGAFAQASGDLSAVAGLALEDVTGACQGIVGDLGGDTNDPGAKGLAGDKLVSFWCGKAQASISGVFTASGMAKAALKVDFQPPQCNVSVSAQASCSAKCDVSGKCDVEATPPKCEGGTLEVECSGACDASLAGGKIDCTGSCDATCQGACEAQGGVAVDCNGKCEGTCMAKAGVGTGTGIQADGTCQGTCSAKCTASATAPALKCTGTCSGSCTGKCSASAPMAKVKCSGGCMAKSTPLECKGGKLTGGCMVDANCSANCNASASAKAECTPPKVSVLVSASATGMAAGQLGQLSASLEARLPALIVVLQARGPQFAANIAAAGSAGGSIVASGKLDAKGAICGADVVAAIGAATTNFKAALDGCTTVVGTVM